MLYDQAQLLAVYSSVPDGKHQDVMHSILKYTDENLLAPGGAYFCAEDADSLPSKDSREKKEGAFALWTFDQIAGVLGYEDAGIFAFIYDVKPKGNIHPESDPHRELADTNVLQKAHSLESASSKFSVQLDQLVQKHQVWKEKLLLDRKKRPKPHLDDKILTSWNGLMISGLCRAFTATMDEKILDRAKGAAKFLVENSKDGLVRSFRQGPSGIPGFADDYACFIQGLIDLYEVTGSESYLIEAEKLQVKMDREFLDHGAYYISRRDDLDAIMRLRDDYDGAEPSSNSVAAMNLLRLAYITGDQSYKKKYWRLISNFHNALQEAPYSLCAMSEAILFEQAMPYQIFIQGTINEMDELIRLRARLCSSVVVFLTPYLVKRHDLKDSPDAYSIHLCRDHVCSAPASRISELDQDFIGTRES